MTHVVPYHGFREWTEVSQTRKEVGGPEEKLTQRSERQSQPNRAKIWPHFVSKVEQRRGLPHLLALPILSSVREVSI